MNSARQIIQPAHTTGREPGCQGDPIGYGTQNIPTTRISRVLTGSACYSLFNWLYDYPLYTIVLWYLGGLWGGLFMALLSIPVDLVTLKFYDWSQEDWFAIEYLKSMREYRGRNFLKRLMCWILTKTPIWSQVVVLSTKFNAFMVTTLLREGAYKYEGLNRRDWAVFWGAYFVGQAYWILVISSGLEVARLFDDLLISLK